MEQSENHSRRRFLRQSAVTATGVTLATQARGVPGVLGANDRIRVGFIGVGNQGTALLTRFRAQPDVEVAALCDVYEPYLTRERSQVDPKLVETLESKVPNMGENFPSSVGRYKDFRHLLERKDIDAVVIATPDHWHALQTIMACESGKDVYVEKPLSVTIVEGRRMIEAARRYNRVVQVGLQQRSSGVFQQVASEVQAGRIGKVTVARSFYITNMTPHGIGKYPDQDPPRGLDWDLWLGPRPKRPYRYSTAPYKFRWWQDYSSQVGNWGVHEFDYMRWVLGAEAPVSVSAHGGRFAVDDDRTIPDTMEVILEFASGALIIYGIYEACSGRAIQGGNVEFRGTLGTLVSSRGAKSISYRIDPSGGGQFQRVGPRMKPVVFEKEESVGAQHVRDFLDCIKSRKTCHCDLETGHRSTVFAHLANIALQTRSRIEWDAQQERITNNPKANRLLHYEYRAPWKLQ